MKADLTSYKNCISASKKADVVFHLAARLGGVEYMYSSGADVYMPNILMNTYMLEAARKNRVEKYLFTSTACIYPYERQLQPDIPCLKEGDAYPAHPESTYGWTKLVGEIQCQAYHQDYKMDISIVRMFNVYGENEDLDPARSHVIPALIRKAILYPREKFIVYGDGLQTRAFLYVSDAVRGLLLTIEKNAGIKPINIGNPKRVKIGVLANKIIKISGKSIKPVYDKSKPVGVVGRAANIISARKTLGWKPLVSLDNGLKRTYRWAEKILAQ
jgi:nucleoside-diphosphate-sugar epimerase